MESCPPLKLQAPPASLSWSQVSKLVAAYRYSCPRAYGYQYLAKLPMKPSPALAAGDGFDAGLNSLLKARMEGHEAERALEWAGRAAEDAFRDKAAGLEPRLTEDKADAYITAICSAISLFAAEREELVPAALQTKHTYTVRQHDGRILRVVGWSDRVDSDGATVDHKWTGSRPWNEEGEWDQGWALDKRDQLCMYWLARRAEERRGLPQAAPVAPRGRLEVLYMRVGQGEPQLNTLEFEFGPEDEHRVLETVREADAILRAGRLPARPGDPCGFCSYRSLCRKHEERAATLTPFATLVGAVE